MFDCKDQTGCRDELMVFVAQNEGAQEKIIKCIYHFDSFGIKDIDIVTFRTNETGVIRSITP